MTSKNPLFRILKNQRGVLSPLLIVLIVLVVGGAAFGGYKLLKSKNSSDGGTKTQQADTASTKLSSTPYQNTEYGFEFTPPEGWVKADVTGTVVFFGNPTADSQGANQLAASLNVTAEQTELSLDDYIAAAETQLASSLTNYKQISKKNIKLGDGTAAVAIEGTFTQASYDIHNRQVVVVENGGAFVLTASSLANKWNHYTSLFETSQATFKSL